MKFGRTIKRLADQDQLNHCIAYDVLKKAITMVFGKPDQNSDELKAVTAALGQNPAAISVGMTPLARFHSLLQHELTKVNRFANLQLRALVETLREAQSGALSEGGLDEAALAKLELLLDSATEQLVSIEHFRRLNFTGFQKIVKKFDKRANSCGAGGGSLACWFLPVLRREFFVAEPLDAQLLALGWGYAALRRHRRGGPGPSKAAPAPTSAKPTCTSTFWLSPQMRMRALCSLIKRFELVVPGVSASDDTPETSAGEFAEQMRRLLLTMSPDGPARGSCHLALETTMVYFDGPGFDQYLGRLQNAGPFGFRARQTTAALGASGGELIERDGATSALGAHAFTPVTLLRSADAFPLHPDAAADSGSISAAAVLAAAERAAAGLEEAAGLAPKKMLDLKAFANEVQEAFKGGPLSCLASVMSSRVVLRGDTPATEGVSIALDDDVRFTQEETMDSGDMESGRAVDFPYCLLEVAEERNGPLGPWLEEIRSYAAMRDVQGFSVGAHAVAALHRDSVPKLPDWYEHLHNMENWAPEEAWGLQKEWRAAVTEAAQEGGEAALAVADMARTRSGRPSAPPGRPAPVGTITVAGEPVTQATIEPKNFMASERTMLEWLHTVLGLAFLGIALWRFSLGMGGEDGLPHPAAMGLVNAASNRSLMLGCYSLVLVVISVCFAWYAVLSHNRRLSALFAGLHTEGVFNARTGPMFFAAAIGFALGMHLLVQAVPVFEGSAGIPVSRDAIP